jgi:DNA-binding protein HU-beta
MVNLKEVVEYAAANNGMSKAATEKVLKDALSYIKSEVAAGNVVNLDKFGKFEPQTKDARQGRNPATGETITIPAKRVVKFKVAKDFADSVK